jgi:hypothetical protein
MLCAPLIHLFALHFGQYHETVGTPGIGAVCDISAATPQALRPAELAAGIYRNSDRDTSVYAVFSSQPWSVGPLRLGAFIGTVNGYEWRHHGRFIPFGGLQASLPTSIGTLRLQLVPRPAPNCAMALGLSLQF